MIKHIEKDVYIKDDATRVSSEKPRYYHSLFDCLRFRHPYYTSALLQFDPDLLETLTTENKDLLNALYYEY